MDVPIQFQDLYAHPAIVLIGPRIHIYPGSLLITSNKRNAVALIKTPLKEICDSRAVPAIGLLEDTSTDLWGWCDGGRIAGSGGDAGCWCDGRSECDGGGIRGR